MPARAHSLAGALAGCGLRSLRLDISVTELPSAGERRLRFVFAVCRRTGSAVTPETAPPAATMVAKDYPFYLSVKRANCALEVQTVTSPAKETEVLNLLLIRLQLYFSL